MTVFFFPALSGRTLFQCSGRCKISSGISDFAVFRLRINLFMLRFLHDKHSIFRPLRYQYVVSGGKKKTSTHLGATASKKPCWLHLFAAATKPIRHHLVVTSSWSEHGRGGLTMTSRAVIAREVRGGKGCPALVRLKENPERDPNPPCSSSEERRLSASSSSSARRT